MKVIFSKKGFDSSNGRAPSPILPSGQLCPLPIPETAYDFPTYYDLHIPPERRGEWQLPADATSLGWILDKLSSPAPSVGGDAEAHADPDLMGYSRDLLPKKLQQQWRGLAGQAGASAGHLARMGVGPGDLFIFFGRFQSTLWRSERLAFDQSRPIQHIAFGWLQVAKKVNIDTRAKIEETIIRYPWAEYHPHLLMGDEKQNTLFIATQRLRIEGRESDLPGWGVFPNAVLGETPATGNILTAPGSGAGTWCMPAACAPPGVPVPLSRKCGPSYPGTKPGTAIFDLARTFGQEFVFTGRPDAITSWVEQLFRVVPPRRNKKSALSSLPPRSRNPTVKP